jgi:hypothetical protein
MKFSNSGVLGCCGSALGGEWASIVGTECDGGGLPAGLEGNGGWSSIDTKCNGGGLPTGSPRGDGGGLPTGSPRGDGGGLPTGGPRGDGGGLPTGGPGGDGGGLPTGGPGGDRGGLPTGPGCDGGGSAVDTECDGEGLPAGGCDPGDDGGLEVTVSEFDSEPDTVPSELIVFHSVTDSSVRYPAFIDN